MAKDYVARMFAVQVINVAGEVIAEERVPAFSQDHAAQIVWDRKPSGGMCPDVWDDAKRGMAKASTGFVRVRQVSNVE